MDYTGSSYYGTDINYDAVNTAGQVGAAAFMGIIAGFWILYMLVLLAVYAYTAVCLMFIAKKTNTPNTWWAWVPILNLLLMFKIANKPWWWIFLVFIPLANIIVLVISWMEIAKKRNKPDWVGILTIVPIIGPFIPAYLAFSD